MTRSTAAFIEMSDLGSSAPGELADLTIVDGNR